MPSIHTDRSIEKAREKGGFAGDHASLPLWELSKRELVEIAIRLGAANAGECDNAGAGIPENNDDRNLMAGCQQCHNRYDAPMRRKGIADRRPLPLFEGDAQ